MCKKCAKIMLLIGIVTFIISCVKGGKPKFFSKKLPVVFVHGIGGVGTFNTIREGFSANGYPTKKLIQVFMPKIGYTGVNCLDSNPLSCPGYYPDYYRTYWDLTGNAVSNVEALKAKIDEAVSLSHTGKIDLIAHSNGTAVVRLLIAHKYKEYAQKIRKVVFISGYADVSGCTTGTSLCRYLNDVTATLPENIKYYSVSSDSDAIFDSVQNTEGTDVRYFAEGIGKNYKLIGMDHLMVATSRKSFKTIYKAITGRCPLLYGYRLLVKIGGYIRERTDYYTYSVGTFPTRQIKVSDAKLKIEYYSPQTGEIIKLVKDNITTDADGNWGPIIVRADRNLKITVTNPDNTAKEVYYFAQKIKSHNLYVEFESPSALTTAVPNGSIFVCNASMAQYFNRHAYENIMATSFDGTLFIKNNDQILQTTELDETHTVPQYAATTPPLYWITHNCFTNFHTNFLTDYGQDQYGFGGGFFPDKTVVFTAKMDPDLSTGKTTTIKFNTKDFSQNIMSMVYYLYPTMIK